MDAGAEFVVSPGIDTKVIELVRERGKLMIAGALTPTEIMYAWKAYLMGRSLHRASCGIGIGRGRARSEAMLVRFKFQQSEGSTLTIQ
jgi:hypothetical protein